VSWDPAPPNGVFGPGTAYTAKVTLTAASGYTFTGVGANAFTHGGGTPSNEADSGVITIGFPETAETGGAPVLVDDLDLTAKVPAPVTGGTPVTYFSAPQYTGTVEWYANGTPLSGLFAAGTAYTAKVTLTAASGYTLDGVGNFSHGDKTNLEPVKNGGKADVTIGFTATAGMPVTDLDLTLYLSAPVTGKAPDTSFSASAPQYTGTVTWALSGGGAVVGKFEAGTAYTATVTLKAKQGYAFDGAGKFGYTGSKNISQAENSDGSMTVTIGFSTGPKVSW
jgi:hypothetical protein